MSILFKPSSKWRFLLQFVPGLTLLFALPVHAQTGTITGQVLCDDTQKPARFAGLETEGSGQRVITQVDGTFVLRNVTAGDREIEVFYPGYVRTSNWVGIRHDADADTIRNLNNIEAQTRVTVLPGRTTNAILILSRGAELSGTITYEDGAPAAGFDVNATYVMTPAGSGFSSLTPAKASLGPRTSTTTDSHGRFHIDGLIAGNYIIATRAGERPVPFSTYFGNTVEASKATQVSVKTGEVRSDLDIRIGLSLLHQVRGFVFTASRQPVAKASVHMNFADDGNNEEERLTTTGEDGAFVFPSVPDGSFVLQGEGAKGKIPATAVIVSGQDVGDVSLVVRP